MSFVSKVASASLILFALTATASAFPASVTTDLNMRTGPGTNHGVLTVLPAGATVDVHTCAANWCRIAHRGRVGYVSERFLAPLRETRQVVPPFLSAPLLPGFGRPPRAVCVEARAEWALGRRAHPAIVERARMDANARQVRVIGPDDMFTQDFRRDRLNIEVNRRDRIIDLTCG